jgi:hypothetical protein
LTRKIRKASVAGEPSVKLSGAFNGSIDDPPSPATYFAEHNSEHRAPAPRPSPITTSAAKVDSPSLSASQSSALDRLKSASKSPAESHMFSHQYNRQLSASAPPDWRALYSSPYPAPNMRTNYPTTYRNGSWYQNIPRLTNLEMDPYAYPEPPPVLHPTKLPSLVPSMASEYYAEEDLSPFGIGYASIGGPDIPYSIAVPNSANMAQLGTGTGENPNAIDHPNGPPSLSPGETPPTTGINERPTTDPASISEQEHKSAHARGPDALGPAAQLFRQDKDPRSPNPVSRQLSRAKSFEATKPSEESYSFLVADSPDEFKSKSNVDKVRKQAMRHYHNVSTQSLASSSYQRRHD